MSDQNDRFLLADCFPDRTIWINSATTRVEYLICVICGRPFHYDAIGADAVHTNYTPVPFHYATLRKP